MSEWKVSSLKEFIKVSSGEGLPDSKMNPGQHPVYGGNGIMGFHNEFLFKEPRLIIGRVGALCGNVHITQNNSWITDNALIVSFLNSNEDVIFWYYILSNINLREYAFQSAQPVITGGIVEKIKINIPVSTSERGYIAHILITCDTVIKQTQSAIAKYKAIKQGLLHDLFTRGLDANGHLRPSYQVAPELYKESDLGMIPKEWEVKRFGDFVHLIHGFQFRDYDFTENGIPIVKIGQIKPENVDLSNCSFISKDRIDEFRSITIRNGDVLMALTGATLGKACQVKKLKNDVLQNYRVGRFEPKNLDEIHKGFLYYTLTTRQFLNQVFSKVNAGAQGNIGKSDFEKPLFKLPDINEQRRIFVRLESLNHKLESEETLLQKYQSIKRGLMGDLLGGRKTVGERGDAITVRHA